MAPARGQDRLHPAAEEDLLAKRLEGDERGADRRARQPVSPRRRRGPRTDRAQQGRKSDSHADADQADGAAHTQRAGCASVGRDGGAALIGQGGRCDSVEGADHADIQQSPIQGRRRRQVSRQSIVELAPAQDRQQQRRDSHAQDNPAAQSPGGAIDAGDPHVGVADPMAQRRPPPDGRDRPRRRQRSRLGALGRPAQDAHGARRHSDRQNSGSAVRRVQLGRPGLGHLVGSLYFDH